MQKLIPALVKARLAFKPIAKDRINPHYKTKYATLDSVLDAVTEPLAANGLAIVQTVNPVAEQPILTTHLYHESGESIESNYPLPAIADPQKLGAAITYARRYALCAILSVTADEDDDGNSSSNKPQPSSNVTPIERPAPDNGMISEAQRKRLYAIATREGGYDKESFRRMIEGAGYSSTADIPRSKYDQLCDMAKDPGTAQIYSVDASAL